ncbi:unnamed protein product [Porites lobata]|uniref:Uncharacterized protein n=1 Tax=Porites lobata TaxID=104759 RepID=A0ABN8QPV9_9CNID|nr:unnamed protein product [Porites lobata]
MTIQCDHIIEARRPVIVVVEKESNKAIIVDIASPWDHRVYEKESEKVEKYQDLKRETRKSMGNIQLDHYIEHNKPDIVLLNKEHKSCIIVDVACPSDTRIISKNLREKTDNYCALK